MDAIRVVLADDHTLFREGTRGLLEHAGDIEVVGEAGDGETALALIARTRPDIAILDIEMPGMNGIEVTRHLRSSHPEVLVLALTVHDEAPFVFAVLEAGAAGYLIKDVNAHELIEAVRALSRGESVLHPSIARQVLARMRGGDTAGCPAPVALGEGELAVLRCAARGLSNPDIAAELGIGLRTVQWRFRRILEALGATTRMEAIICGLRLGLVTLEEQA
jgi:DNA-binding NarL/FixJ family response regulator